MTILKIGKISKNNNPFSDIMLSPKVGGLSISYQLSKNILRNQFIYKKRPIPQRKPAFQNIKKTQNLTSSPPTPGFFDGSLLGWRQFLRNLLRRLLTKRCSFRHSYQIQAT